MRELRPVLLLPPAARDVDEEKVGKRINLERTDEALDTGAEKIVTGCPFCRSCSPTG